MNIVEVQKAVIEKDGKYLILLRSSEAEHYPEHWDFPGGKLEKDEDPKSGIEREILEETGLVAEAGKVIKVYEMDINNEGNITHRFSIYNTDNILGKVKISFEHTDFKWATKDEILKLKIEPYIKFYFGEKV